jgi:hypothetical protein
MSRDIPAVLLSGMLGPHSSRPRLEHSRPQALGSGVMLAGYRLADVLAPLLKTGN